MQHENGHAAWKWTCNMDVDMPYGHGHAGWTWTRRQIWSYSMDLDNRHALKPECQNADNAAQSGIVSFLVVYNAKSGIGIPASWSVRYR
jgi:hypothetical protein